MTLQIIFHSSLELVDKKRAEDQAMPPRDSLFSLVGLIPRFCIVQESGFYFIPRMLASGS
jgi:hypothetical protein